MASEYVDRGIPFLRSLNIEPFRINLDDVKFITDEFHARLRKSALRPGDVVIVRTGKPGTCAVVPEWLETSNCSDLVIVRCGPEVLPKYLAYWVNSLAAHHVGSNTVGAVQQHFNVGAAKQMPLLLPSLGEQELILSALATLDDKIELNRRMNETLEAMAQAIFREWFVDFGPVRRKLAGATDPVEIMGDVTTDPVRAAELAGLFPDAFGDDETPVGWVLQRLDELATLSKGAINPLSFPEETFEHYSLPAYDDGEEPVLDAGETIKSNKALVPMGAVLLSKLNPDIQRVWLPNPPSGMRQVASTEFLVFEPKGGGGRALLYFLFKDRTVRQTLQSMVTGTSKSHQRVSPPALLQSTLLVASDPCAAAFGEIAEPIIGRCLALRAENRTLAETRDYLLPRLMSGEVRVGELTQEIAA